MIYIKRLVTYLMSLLTIMSTTITTSIPTNTPPKKPNNLRTNLSNQPSDNSRNSNKTTDDNYRNRRLPSSNDTRRVETTFDVPEEEEEFESGKAIGSEEARRVETTFGVPELKEEFGSDKTTDDNSRNRRLPSSNDTRRVETTFDVPEEKEEFESGKAIGAAEQQMEFESEKARQEMLRDYDVTVCNRVLGPGSFGKTDKEMKVCQGYDSLPLIVPDCTGRTDIIPRILHTVSRDSIESYHLFATTSANPTFTRRHHSDESAKEYVRSKCGQEAADAYSCFMPPAYRADLFRFCAMYADGGVYLDGDVVPLVPVDQLYSKCSVATIGYDFPQLHEQGKQMKILAAAPGAPIFKCALEKVIQNVRKRYFPWSSLKISGPVMLHECYEKHPEDVAITYHDTRAAEWPFTGLRAGEKILAYEMPGPKSFKARRGELDASDYAVFFENREIYSETCSLPVECGSTLQGADLFHSKGGSGAICSSNGAVRFGYDEDGDLSLEHHGVKVWSAQTKGMDTYASMQWDGNLVVHNITNNEVIWASNTGGNIGSILSVDDDGKARIRIGDRITWETDA